MTEYAYMVIDHTATSTVCELDGYGKRYLRCPPASLGEFRLSSSKRVWVPSADGDEAHEVEVPLYHRDAMPAGWPKPWVRGAA